MVHVWYIYLHLVDFYGINVGKYTSPMEPWDLDIFGQTISRPNSADLTY